ncbi:MAG: hypothetical protein K8T90_11050 [Planctomycetes bacterium]|nr:hypothetical protein [Planctomycetota bacterium]
MQPMMSMYVAYVALSVGLTVWVGRTLHRNGRVFLHDVFAGNTVLADAVNQLLVVGFYLVNFGYVSLMLRSREAVGTPEAAVEALSWKIGLVLLVLGAMHFTNMIVLAKCRRSAVDEGGRRGPAPAGAGDAGGKSSFGDVSFGRPAPSRWGFPQAEPPLAVSSATAAVAACEPTVPPAVPRLEGLIPRPGDGQ